MPVQRNQPPAAPEEVADALGVAIAAAVGADASFEAREAAALALTNEATRLFLERELLAIADGHGTHVEVDGVIYQRHAPGIVRYFTLCGAVDIEPYREMGVRTVHGATHTVGSSIATSYSSRLRAPAAGGAGAGRRRRHLTAARRYGGGRPGRRDARDASQDAA